MAHGVAHVRPDDPAELPRHPAVLHVQRPLAKFGLMKDNLMNQNTFFLVLVAMLLSSCGNFLGRTGEQMTDQPQKEREQARTAKQYDQPARTRHLPPGQ